MPTGLAVMGQPVSVCHQWSTTGTPSTRSAQRTVSGSDRSPARNSVRSDDRSWRAACSPAGSSRRIARIAVGAVKKETTPCSATTRQKVPGSGVPTGLPSNTTLVQPCSSGA